VKGRSDAGWATTFVEMPKARHCASHWAASYQISLVSQLQRVGSGRRFTFSNHGEQILDAWMARNATVARAVVQKPWEVEAGLLASLRLPLNLQGNIHPATE